jgi:hypothetical protein
VWAILFYFKEGKQVVNERCIDRHAYQDEKMINQIVFPVKMMINFHLWCYLYFAWIKESRRSKRERFTLKYGQSLGDVSPGFGQLTLIIPASVLKFKP